MTDPTGEHADELVITHDSGPALGTLIRRLRLDAGVSQAELARRVGTTQSGVSRLEAGMGSGTKLDTLVRIAEALDRHLLIAFTAPA